MSDNNTRIINLELAVPAKNLNAQTFYYPSAQQPRADATTGSLLEYALVVRRRWLTVLAVTCAMMIAGYIFTREQSPVFQAKTLIEVQHASRDAFNATAPVSDGSTPISHVQIQAEILMESG